MKAKKIAAILLSMCLASAMTACGSDAKETGSSNTSASKSTSSASKSDSSKEGDVQKVKLTVWGPQEDQAPLDGYDKGILPAMCEAFDEAHPEWEIEFEYGVCSEGDAKDVITKDVDAAADVYMFANDQIPVLVESGAIAKLGGATADAVKSENPESMVASVTYED